MSIFYNETPLRGIWLFDADRDIAPFVFDITDQKMYPLSEIRRSPEVEEAIANFKKLYCDSYQRNGRHCGTPVPDSDTLLVNHLFKIITSVRDTIASYDRLAGQIIPSYQCFSFCTDELLPEEELTKRRWFLYAARSVINGLAPIQKVAFKNRIPELTLRIWISAFLNHGPLSFFRKQQQLSHNLKRGIANIHTRYNKSNVVKTCAQFCMLNQNRLKHCLQTLPKS